MPATPAVTNTVIDIIKDAMVDAGILGSGSEPDSDQLAENMRRLCDVINIFQVGGLKLFVYEELTITLVAGTQTYTIATPSALTLPNRHIKTISARILSTENNTRRINQVSWDEFTRLSVEASSGAIVSYVEKKTSGTLTISFYPIPDSTEATNTVKILTQKQIDNPTNLTDAMQFPLEWRMALRWGLADDICTGQPESIMRRCAQKAEYYRTLLEDFDVESAPTSFAPDTTLAYPTGAFR